MSSRIFFLTFLLILLSGCGHYDPKLIHRTSFISKHSGHYGSTDILAVVNAGEALGATDEEIAKAKLGLEPWTSEEFRREREFEIKHPQYR